MKRSMIAVVSAIAMMLLTCAAANAGTYTWDFTNAADYYVDGDSGTPPAYVDYRPVITVGVGAYVPARPWINSDDDAYGSDWASVFARINTQAYHLGVGSITDGGFTLSGMNHPDAVYGSLYLSPTGGSGSTVLILLSPMGRTGSEGAYEYTFDLDTHADVRTRTPPGDWSAYNEETSGTFAHAIDWINDNVSGDKYAAFWGPQIGMSGTSGTTFTVSQIQLVPEPATVALLALGGIGMLLRRRRSK